MRNFVNTITATTGKTGSIAAVPLPMLRVLSVLMRVFNAALARQMPGAVVMDSEDMTADASIHHRRFPEMQNMPLADVIRRSYTGPTD